jgi:cathepsin D
MPASTLSVSILFLRKVHQAHDFAACGTSVTVTLNFGGKDWAISPVDMNLGELRQNECLGGIFDLGQGTSIQGGNGNPSWVVGDTFLKNVYSVFRADPPAVGFASLANGVQDSSSGSVASVSATATVGGTSSQIIPTTNPLTSGTATGGVGKSTHAGGTSNPSIIFTGPSVVATATVGSGSGSGSSGNNGAAGSNAISGVLLATALALVSALTVVF